MSRQTICTNCTRFFKRGIIQHRNVEKGIIRTERELICVWRQFPMNNINVAFCNAFKKRSVAPTSDKYFIPSNIEGKSINV